MLLWVAVLFLPSLCVFCLFFCTLGLFACCLISINTLCPKKTSTFLFFQFFWDTVYMYVCVTLNCKTSEFTAVLKLNRRSCSIRWWDAAAVRSAAVVAVWWPAHSADIIRCTSDNGSWLIRLHDYCQPVLWQTGWHVYFVRRLVSVTRSSLYYHLLLFLFVLFFLPTGTSFPGA